MISIFVGDQVIVDVKRAGDLAWSDGKKRVALTEQQISDYLNKHTTMHRRCCNDAASGMIDFFGEEKKKKEIQEIELNPFSSKSVRIGRLNGEHYE